MFYLIFPFSTPPVVFPGSGTDPFLPPDPRSLVNYHPSVRHLVGGLKSYYHYTSMRNLDQILREGVIRPSYRQGLWLALFPPVFLLPL